MSSPSLGAYGFRLSCPQAGDPLPNLIEVEPSSPPVQISWRNASTVRYIEEVEENRVAYGFRGGTTYYVEREPRAIRFDIPNVPSPAALVHPLLTIGISVLARWRGDVTLHAGAFETASGGWVVMGPREAGKSSLLAAMGQHGQAVVADDLAAIQDGLIWAGPSCVDLRPDTAGRFESAVSMGIVGGRLRYRLSTRRPSAPRVPLRGFFILGWNEHNGIDARPLSPKERLHWLYQQEYIRLVGFADPTKMLPLIALPAWELTRPRNWEATSPTVERVLEITESR